MKYTPDNGNIVLVQPDFDLEQTLDCGQAFRWKKLSGSVFTGHFLNRELTVSQDGSVFTFHNTAEEDFLNIWADYFDFHTDYGELKRIFSADPTLEKACKFAGGIRLLKQDGWESLCSFIISQNNNIPRIKGIIERLCGKFGGFPDAAQLSGLNVTDLADIRSGFRAKYLCDAADKVSAGQVDFQKLKSMPIGEARRVLMSVKGVGPKVAECVLLFGLNRREAFPVDVWIKRVLEEYYPNGLPGFALENAGVAQQYLFHYIRNCTR